ncbi:tannase and feruloyl esterase [Hypoxylon rubiginosum]|uniref:Tannase and feruloyl esterase n=1 Tax=Hypoxylon rubiginosum TaxID=110542 RepID=A0ACC0CSC0_9PEZI|nr:tannase and feruloyl esterase [Hypoxylon rubiginosum]
MVSFTWSIAILAGAIAHQVASSPESCASFCGQTSIPNVTVIASEYLLNGSQITLPGTVESCGGSDLKANITADLCRLVLIVATTPSSEVQIEAWLPDAPSWNGRSLSTGNGGIGGCIDYATIQNGAGLGFASFGTNAGHNGSVGYEFFLNQPEVINDFGHRAIHIEAEVSKELVTQYYGSGASKSYYAGCSTGGRQGFQNAHLYPEDFDGMLLGSPGVDWLHIVASKGVLAHRIGWPDLNSSEYVRPEQWPAIVEAQIKQFDALDGVADGIIDEPTKYRFDPASLACGTGLLNSSLCLSPQQIASVRRAYEPIANTSGHIVYPSFELGSKTDVFSDNQVNGTASLSYTILEDFWRGAIYNDSSWTPDNFSEFDMDFAIQANPGQVNAGETNLASFYQKGGKIISYHGRNDETVTSAVSERFFTGVQSTLNLTMDDIHEFYRLFFLPGMHHCSGGLGAWSIGNAQKYPYDQALLDSEHNALIALVEWVENGTAPEILVGTKYENDLIGSNITAQRTYCPYPMASKWDGVNDTSLAASWKCVSY